MDIQAISLGAGGRSGGAHTLDEWFDPAGRELGLQRVALTVLSLAGLEP
jgi:tripeptide aminopeptidase